MPDGINYEKFLNIQSQVETHEKWGIKSTTGFKYIDRILEPKEMLHLNYIETSIQQQMNKIVTT